MTGNNRQWQRPTTTACRQPRLRWARSWVFTITGIDVHDRPDWPFKITGMRIIIPLGLTAGLNLLLLFGAARRGYRGWIGLLFFAIAGLVWATEFIAYARVVNGGLKGPLPGGPLLTLFLFGLVLAWLGVMSWRFADEAIAERERGLRGRSEATGI